MTVTQPVAPGGRKCESLLDPIGNTPVLRVDTPLPREHPGFWVKLEALGPGTMKARAALSMLRGARASGELRPGGTVVESSSGTLAIGLAFVGSALGHPVIIVADRELDAMTRNLLRAYRARVEIVPRPHPLGGWQRARLERVEALLTELPGAYWPDQYDNPDNPAGYRTVGRELGEQFERLDAVVCSVGTGGHSAGIASVVREYWPDVHIVGVDSVGSSVFGQLAQRRLMRGLGSSIHPGNVAYRTFDEVHWLGPAEAADACRRLAAGTFVTGGWSTGATAMVAAWCARELDTDRVAAVFPDGPERYWDSFYDEDFCRRHELLATSDEPSEVDYPGASASARYGTELLGQSDAQRRRARAGSTSALPQHPAAVLNPIRRIGRVLRELAALHHPTRPEQRAAVHEALRAAQLPPARELLRRFPHQLSGGQQQRVALAQALIIRPGLVVLDEPTTGADTMTKTETAGMLAQLAAGGTALVLLTHDLPLARRLAHETLVLHRGRSVEHGSGIRPLRAPAHEHTRTILAAEPRLSATGDEDRPRPPPALRAERISHRAEDGTALLDGVDLSLRPGWCAAIVGRSGVGKTTLGRSLAGLTRPQSGRVVLGDVELAPLARERAREHRRQVQYVHQDARAAFDARRPVTDQVARTAELLRDVPRDQALQEAGDVLETLGVRRSQSDRRPRELSGGQLQRAALARALLARPAVLICDEITASLDVGNQADLLDLLGAVQTTTDVSAVLISHDLAAVRALADEVHLLDAGRLVESAPPHQLLSCPRTRTGAALVAAAREHGSPGQAVESSGRDRVPPR